MVGREHRYEEMPRLAVDFQPDQFAVAGGKTRLVTGRSIAGATYA